MSAASKPPLSKSGMRSCFAWSAKAWTHPFMRFLNQHPGLRVSAALEIGAGARSSLSPVLLKLADRVECSYFDVNSRDAIQKFNAGRITAEEASRIQYARRDVTELKGKWDLIVMKSVLGGVFRVGHSDIRDMHALLARLVTENLNPGGLLVTLDNGCTLLEPLLQRFGARKNGWRFLRAEAFPAASEHYGFGVLSAFSLSTRMAKSGRLAEDLLYGVDVFLSPLTSQHAVHLHVYRNPEPVAIA